MNRPRLIRWLRIAVSAVCVVVCVGLIGLLVRSYKTMDTLFGHLPGVDSLGVASLGGRLGFTVANNRSRQRWEIISREPSVAVGGYGNNDPKRNPWFAFTRFPPFTNLMVPHWFLLAISAALAFVPWIPWSTRFSLRTLLILTTLVAVGLGLVVWALKG